jgi:hypothetical protein
MPTLGVAHRTLVIVLVTSAIVFISSAIVAFSFAIAKVSTLEHPAVSPAHAERIVARHLQAIEQLIDVASPLGRKGLVILLQSMPRAKAGKEESRDHMSARRLVCHQLVSQDRELFSVAFRWACHARRYARVLS